MFSRRNIVFIILVAILDCGQPLLGAQSQTSIFSPQSAPARSIAALSNFTLAITGLIFAVVAGLLVYVIIRFRRRDDDDGGEPPQIFGSTQIELSWTIIPVLIVTVLFLTTARVVFDIQDAPKPKSALDVTVVGHQFWWEVRYPGFQVTTANELHVPISTSSRAGTDVSQTDFRRCGP